MRSHSLVVVTAVLAMACGTVRDISTVDGGAPSDSGEPVADAAITDAGDPNGIDAQVGPCPAQYVEGDNDNCYRLVSEAATWLAAEEDCENDSLGAHLVVVTDNVEHSVLHDLTGSVDEYWLGYTDRASEGTFAWITVGGLNPEDESVCYWGETGPINAPDLDCVVQDGDDSCGDWFVRNCDATRPYVCEFDALLVR